MARRGINKAIILGRLGQDPDLRYMPNGDAVVNLSIATSEVWTDSHGQEQERTTWHRIVAFRGLAEFLGEHFVKGCRIHVEGKLQTRKWQDSEGMDRYTTEIVADEVEPIDWASDMDGGNNQGNRGNRGNNQGNRGNRGNSRQQPRQQQAPQQPPPPQDDFEDDIPF